MKVSDLSEPVHTGSAVFGCLLGFTKISAEMQDPDLKRLAERIGRVEGLPVVTNPGILAPEQFLDEVLTLRIPNPLMPDTPQRIATDTSQKLGVRFGETVKAYWKRRPPAFRFKAAIPLVYAGWLRYLLGIDDQAADAVKSGSAVGHAAAAAGSHNAGADLSAAYRRACYFKEFRDFRTGSGNRRSY